MGNNTQPSGDLISPSTGDKRKRLETDEFEPRKTRGIKNDYCYLNDPFPDEEDILTSEDQYAKNAIIASNDLTSLTDTQNSPDWPEWE